MRVYDVGNARHKGLFVMANDEDDAKEIAVVLNHVRNKKNAHPHDITDRMMNEPGICELMDQSYRGSLMKRLRTFTFTEVMNGTAWRTPDTSKWLSMKSV